VTSAAIHEPFHDLARQREADRLGMLVFLASEVMLFGGLFAAALGLRLAHPVEYIAASQHTHLWLGTANTAVLLSSSLLVALAVEAAKAGRARRLTALLLGAALLGVAFAAIKGTEYWLEYRDGLMPGVDGSAIANGAQRLFLDLYFVSTGLHALHLTIGVALLVVLAVRALAGRREPVLVANVGLYWHLVDIVWIFLFPTLYLARPA
jgi:cytochrome c oxidase subunit 3